MECVFFETALRLDDSRTHAAVECVPVPMEGGGGSGRRTCGDYMDA